MKTVVCFTCAVLCHLILLFSFHLGSSARPLPMSDESSLVEVNLVATAQEPAVEPAAPAEPLSTPEPTPMPTPEPTQTPNQEPASTSTSAIPEPPRTTAKVPSRSTSSSKPAHPKTTVIGTSSNAPAKSGPITITAARPRYRSNPPPEYPMEARRLHQEGIVLLTVEVDSDGHTSSVHIKRSSGIPNLNQAALNAVRRWTFEPAHLIGGLPVASTVDVPLRFSLAK